jgi:CheY-like chemotaxis protein
MLKVAVLDANAISRNLLSSVLTGGGHQVVTDSNTSAAAIANVVRQQPQLICIDIGGADDGGWEKVATLRDGLPKALLFLVSGKMDHDAVQRAVQLGVQGFIVKPFNATTVLGTIQKTILQLAKRHCTISEPRESQF